MTNVLGPVASQLLVAVRNVALGPTESLPPQSKFVLGSLVTCMHTKGGEVSV